MPTWFALLVLLQLVKMLEWHRYAVISQTLLWDVMGSAIELLHPRLIALRNGAAASRGCRSICYEMRVIGQAKRWDRIECSNDESK